MGKPFLPYTSILYIIYNKVYDKFLFYLSSSSTFDNITLGVLGKFKKFSGIFFQKTDVRKMGGGVTASQNFFWKFF